MADLIYLMLASLDGFVADESGNFGWAAPDEELHRFHNERVRSVKAHFLGRRLYETMVYWESDDRAWGEPEREFAEIWQALPKVVFSATLNSVVGNARLARAGIAEEVAALDGELAVGGAGLAASFIELGLVDEVGLFVSPVVVGGGTPFFPAGARLDLELLETRTFASRVVYMRCRRRS